MKDFGMTDEERNRVIAKRLDRAMHYMLEVNGKRQPLKSFGIRLGIREHQGTRTPVLEILLKDLGDGVYTSIAVPPLLVDLEATEHAKARLNVKRAD
jgi:hypothetical protein